MSQWIFEAFCPKQFFFDRTVFPIFSFFALPVLCSPDKQTIRIYPLWFTSFFLVKALSAVHQQLTFQSCYEAL